MFTGIVEEVGTISRVARRAGGAQLWVRAGVVLGGTETGDSIAVSGACLTVVDTGPDFFVADCMEETLQTTTLGDARAGTRVNLERALAYGERLGGHMVLGHVDATGAVASVERTGVAYVVRLSLPRALEGLLAPKGSVAVDGISLTVIDVEAGWFSVGIIPHTWGSTTLGEAAPGRTVNLEADVIARYVRQALTSVLPSRDSREGQANSGLTEETLRSYGFA